MFNVSRFVLSNLFFIYVGIQSSLFIYENKAYYSRDIKTYLSEMIDEIILNQSFNKFFVFFALVMFSKPSLD
jgi:hypothetical protein